MNQQIQAFLIPWLFNGWEVIFKFNTSNITTSDISQTRKIFIKPEEESLEKIIEIFQERINCIKYFEQRAIITTVIGTQDFLPSSFLARATQASLAVCRIVRNFPHEDFINVVIRAKKLTQELKIPYFDTPEEVKEIFSIPQQVADQLFADKSVTPLEALEKITESQLAKINPLPIGTGFLVGGSYLMTNHHVIHDIEEAQQCIAQFNYIDDLDKSQVVAEYELFPQGLFVCNDQPELDYVVVQLKPEPYRKQAGFQFGWLSLVESDNNIAPGLDTKTVNLLKKNNFSEDDLKLLGWTAESKNIFGEPVIIIQHPKGRRKQITIYNNQVNDLKKYFLRYQADSDYGSSGSPVLNTRLELVAINHAAIPKNINLQENLKIDDRELKIDAEQGVRICRIVEDLKIQSLGNSKLRSFMQDFVISAEQLNYPPLPSALELDGVNDYVLLKDFQQPKSLEEFTLEAWVCPYSYDLENTIFSKFFHSQYQGEIATLGYDSLQVYITTEGKIVISHRMHTLPTLPLELPEDESKKEVIFNLQSILKTLYKPDGDVACYNIPLSGEEDELTKAAIQEFCSDFDIVESSGININSKLLDNLNSQITYIGRYQLNYDQIENEKSMLVEVKPSRGEIVKALQNILKILDNNIYKGEINGIFEESTCEAVKKLQESCGLDKDGVFGPLTQKIITSIQSYEYKTPESLKLREYNHIAITYTGEKVAIYINGKKSQYQICSNFSKSGAQKLQRASISTPRSIDISQGSPLIVGAYSRKNLAIPNFPLKGNLEKFFRGSIAEIRLWNCVRTKDEIYENMSRRLLLKEKSSEREKLIGYWRFEEGKGSEVHNLVTASSTESSSEIHTLQQNNNELSTIGATSNKKLVAEASTVQQNSERWLRQSNYPALPLPFALKFNGKDDYIDCGNDANLNISDGITIEAWVKHLYGDGLIVGREDDKCGYSIAWINNRIRVNLKNNESVSQVETQETAWSDRMWHHIAFSWGKIINNSFQDEIEIYIDGQRQKYVALKGEAKSILIGGQYNTWGIFKEQEIAQPDEVLTIGGRKEKDHFNGAIAEVRLWKVARTQDDIKKNMSLRLRGNEKGLIGYWRLDDGSDGNRLHREAFNLANKDKPAKIYGAVWYPKSVDSTNIK